MALYLDTDDGGGFQVAHTSVACPDNIVMGADGCWPARWLDGRWERLGGDKLTALRAHALAVLAVS